jgi:hypothetical protein
VPRASLHARPGVADLLRLYGVDAVLRLQSTEEEEQFFSLTAASNPVKASGS